MAKQGRDGAALGSLIAGTLSLIALMFLAPVLAEIALKFGPPEYCTPIIMSLSLITYLVRGSMLRALMMACLGLLLAQIGADPITAKLRINLSLKQKSATGWGMLPLCWFLVG